MHLIQRNGPIFYTTNTAGLIGELTRRGWYECTVRNSVERCRMRRNTDVIIVGLQGTIVPCGPAARSVLNELVRSAVQL